MPTQSQAHVLGRHFQGLSNEDVGHTITGIRQMLPASKMYRQCTQATLQWVMEQLVETARMEEFQWWRKHATTASARVDRVKTWGILMPNTDDAVCEQLRCQQAHTSQLVVRHTGSDCEALLMRVEQRVPSAKIENL